MTEAAGSSAQEQERHAAQEPGAAQGPGTAQEPGAAQEQGARATWPYFSTARVPLPVLLVVFTPVYFLAGKLGLALAFVHASASAFWPPTGIAIAAALLFGLRIWPAIFVGAFLVNLTTSGDVATSLGIASGNTLEAVVAAWLVRRFAGGAAVFDRPHDVFRFTILAAALSTMVSASVGVLSLWGGGLAETAALPTIWLTWWLGDAVGALVFAPLVVLWVRPGEPWLAARSWLEAAALAVAVAGLGWIVFGFRVPNGYLCLAPLIWAAFRFGSRGAVTAAAATSGIALWGTLLGSGPFARPSPGESLLFLQAFVGTITLIAVVLAAVVRERERVGHALRRARAELEEKVEERTASLREAVQQLEKSRSALHEAQRIAHIGSWDWDIPADHVSWSDELHRIYGLEPGSREITYDTFLELVHPEDRDRVKARVEEAYASGAPFEIEHRIVRPDGELRTLHAHGSVVADAEGRPVRMVGTGQDITARVLTEQALRQSEQRFRVLAEQASDIISFSTPDQPASYISPAVRRVLGYDPAELTGRWHLDLVHPDDLPGIEEIRGRLGQGSELAAATFRVRHKAGHYVWFESVAGSIRSGTGEFEGTVTVSRDVTERVEGTRFHELLQRVTRVANEATSADEALRATVEEICRFKSWPLGHVYMVATDGSGELMPTTIWYPEEPGGHQEFRRVTEATRFRQGIGLPGRVLASGQPVWIPNVIEDPNFPRARLVRNLELAAAFGFPIRAGEETLAVLEFFTTEVLSPDPRFVEVLDEIGSQVGQVLRRQQVEEALRNREAQLAQAQSIAHVGSWDWDVLHDQVTWSDELFRIHGHEPGSIEVSYADVLAHIHPSDRARIDRVVKAAYLSGEPFRYEYRLVRPDGTVRVVQTEGRVVKDAAGRTEHMFGACQDVTDRKAAEDALRSSEQRHRFLADYSTDVITIVTPEGICTYASPAARALLGYPAEELVGRPVADFVHPDDAAAVAEARRAILKSFASQSVTCRLRRKSGGWVWTETTSRGVRTTSGMVESIVGVTRNVTERLRAAEMMRLLQRVTSIANEATTVESAMRLALETICRHAGWPLGHVYLPSRSGDGRLASSDIWHVEEPERFVELRKLSEKTPFAASEGLPGSVLASGKPQWITDLSGDPFFLRKPEAEALGLVSAFAFPIKAHDETLAVLEFFATEPRPFDEDLLGVMENVGAQLGEVVRRHRAEAALRTSEVHFRAVAETAGDAVITIDDESRIVYCNPSAARIFGHDDLVGKPLTTIIPERFHAPHLAGLTRFLKTGEAPILGKTVELMGLHRNGSEIPVELSISDWRTDEGFFFTGIVRDITERKRAEEALNEKVEELARSNAELALFSYVASHDLREPLRTVASNVQLLERGLGDRMTPAARKSARFALDGVHRMQALIDDLLAYSRVGTEAREFQRVDTDVVLDDVLAGLKATIESADGVVTRGEMPTVWADRMQLAQVFQNLLSNALKFHLEQPPLVHVSAARNGEAWVFSVRDEGIGFDPQLAEHIFTLFQRFAPEDFPGTGIGLAICRKIVERHGGRIWAESAPGQGSTFHFTLPARD